LPLPQDKKQEGMNVHSNYVLQEQWMFPVAIFDIHYRYFTLLYYIQGFDYVHRA
jgi:hypothetical protein